MNKRTELNKALYLFKNNADPATIRRFCADCAERVLYIFEERRPNDDRPRKAIELARNPNASKAELKAARNASRLAAVDARNTANVNDDFKTTEGAWSASDAARAAENATWGDVVETSCRSAKAIAGIAEEWTPAWIAEIKFQKELLGPYLGAKQ